MSDLQSVIEDSITDAEIQDDPIVDDAPVSDEPAVEASSDEPAQPIEPEGDSQAVASPASKAAEPAEQDEFGKKYGIPQQSESGRENRIPYSRVKKITEKAVKEREAELQTTYTKQISDYESKVKDYEGRLQTVVEFENFMLNQPEEFLTRLAQIPAYQQIFQAIAGQAQAQPQQPAVPSDRPGPDQQLEDGTMVYSMEGLDKLMAWERAQAAKEAVDQISQRYAPIEQSWQAHQTMQRLVPQVQAQIDEARKWPQFNENEAAITEALAKNSRLSLEGAYRQVVIPKLIEQQQKVVADRNKVRADVLDELRRAPAQTTSVPSRSSRPAAQQSTGPRSLEDVISDAIRPLQR